MKLDEAAGMVIRGMAIVVAQRLAHIEATDWPDKETQQKLEFEVAIEQLREHGFKSIKTLMRDNQNSQIDFSKAYPVPDKAIYEPTVTRK